MIQLYNSFKEIVSKKSISIDEYQKLIKEGYQLNQIDSARKITDKYSTNKELYRKCKSERICCTMNFSFNGIKANNNISHSTGYLLYDIDKFLDISILDMNKIFMMHKSFGGVNYYIIVKVNGLTLENFSDVYNGIGNELGLSGIFDTCAKKATQYMLISYDPDIYINNDSKIFDVNNYYSKKEIKEKKDKRKEDIRLNVSYQETSVEISDEDFIFGLKNPENLFTQDYADSIIHNSDMSNFKKVFSGWNINNEHLYNVENYNYYPSGIKTATIYLRKDVPHGKQNTYLCSICQNLMGLNPNRTISEYKEKMLYVIQYANIMIHDEDLDRIINNYFKYLVSGKLQLNYNTKKKFIFNTKCKDKKSICNKIIGKTRSANTLERIILMYKEVLRTEKPLQRVIAKRLKISIKTVQRYWCQVIKKFKSIKVINTNRIRKNSIKKQYFIFNDVLVKGFINNINIKTINSE